MTLFDEYRVKTTNIVNCYHNLEKLFFLMSKTVFLLYLFIYRGNHDIYCIFSGFL